LQCACTQVIRAASFGPPIEAKILAGFVVSIFADRGLVCETTNQNRPSCTQDAN